MRFTEGSRMKFLFTLLILIANSVYANPLINLLNLEQSGENFNYTEYYSIKEDPRFQNFNLLALDLHNEKFPLPSDPYNRNKHFGGWLRDEGSAGCLNTRGKVLVRDSADSVSYISNGCTVEAGLWNDPYSAQALKLAKDIQIDHVVALKNAYMTGAFEWDFKKRCLYANYMGNNFHLLSVSGKENLKKSDLTPNGYVPPNKAYSCQYIKQWLNVKLIWTLRITPQEAVAINKIASDSNCDPQMFVITSQELKEQRDFMANNANLCSVSPNSLEKF